MLPTSPLWAYCTCLGIFFGYWFGPFTLALKWILGRHYKLISALTDAATQVFLFWFCRLVCTSPIQRELSTKNKTSLSCMHIASNIWVLAQTDVETSIITDTAQKKEQKPTPHKRRNRKLLQSVVLAVALMIGKQSGQ